MKRWVIWLSSALILSFLIIRLFKNHVDGVKRERRWYIEQLDFEFSGIIDTISNPGNIRFHVTQGNLDKTTEKRLKERLQYNGRLDLLLYKPNNKFDLRIDSAYKYIRGDSLYLNSNKNVVRIYRNNRLVTEKELLKSMRGRPF